MFAHYALKTLCRPSFLMILVNKKIFSRTSSFLMILVNKKIFLRTSSFLIILVNKKIFLRTSKEDLRKI